MNENLSTMTIVKNGEEYIRAALLSVKDYVKEMLVCDTGSTDNTIEIINELITKGLNIKLLHRGPFSGTWESKIPGLTEVRNELTELCSTDFILIVDDDEIFPKEIFEELKEVLKNKTIMAVAMPFYQFVDRNTILKESLYPCMKRVINVKQVRFQGTFPRESTHVIGENKWLSNFTDSRVITIKSRFYHYNLAKKNAFRPRQTHYDTIKFEGKQLEEFINDL